MSRIKTRPFDVSNYLNDEADIAAYLQAAIEDGDPALLAAALGDIASATQAKAIGAKLDAANPCRLGLASRETG